MKKAIIIALALFTLAPTAQPKDKEAITVTAVTADADAANNGLIYSLPQTVVTVRVTAELTICKAGPYYKYSNKCLNLSNVITEDSHAWRIVSAEIGSYGIADATRRYKISATNTSLPQIALTDDNILAAINGDCPEARIKPCDVSPEIPELNFDDVKLDKSVLTKTSTAAMAEEAALTIYRLREQRMSLLGGEDATVLNDRGSYDRVLEELEQLENDHLSLFVGKKITLRFVRYFELVPDVSGTSSSVLFRFSEEQGFLGAMDLNGKPVYVDVAFDKSTQLSEYSATSKQRQAEPADGLRYIMPGAMNVKVIDRNVLIAEANLLCSQNGQIVTLPAALLLDTDRQLLFNTTNGALRSINKK